MCLSCPIHIQLGTHVSFLTILTLNRRSALRKQIASICCYNDCLMVRTFRALNYPHSTETAPSEMCFLRGKCDKLARTCRLTIEWMF